MLPSHARILPNRLLNAGQMEINYFQLKFIKHVIQNGQKEIFYSLFNFATRITRTELFYCPALNYTQLATRNEAVLQ